MKFNKTLLLISLVCVAQTQAIDFSYVKEYTKESLKSLKDKAALGSFLTGFWWHYLTKNQKTAAKVIAVASAAYLAKKLINSLEFPEVKKNNSVVLNDNQESKIRAEVVNLNHKPVNYSTSESINSDVIHLHNHPGHSKFAQLIDLFHGIGLILHDVKMTSDKVNMSKVSIIGKIITIQLNLETCSRVVVIKHDGDFSYKLISNDIVYHEII